jgi:hypothetical protein
MLPSSSPEKALPSSGREGSSMMRDVCMGLRLKFKSQNSTFKKEGARKAAKRGWDL